jgi:WD40 repeat protein
VSGSRYRAFLSYSHQDRRLAVDVQRSLHRLGRAWYQRPAFTVFRDDSSLGAGALWENLERALAQSDYLVLLASPEAAKSEWVGREARWWIDNRDADNVLLVLTRGEIDWDDSSGDLAASTTAVPFALHGAFSEEPRWVDLRESAAGGDSVLPGDPAFQDRVADLAATLHGCDKSELVGEELRQRHRWARVRNSAIALLAVLALAAASASLLFFLQLRESQAQTARAEAREFAARSQRSSNPYEALAFAVEAESRTDDALPEARLAYTRAIQQVAAQPVRPVSALLLSDGHVFGTSALSPDGRRFAATIEHGWQIRDAQTAALGATGGVEDERSIKAIDWAPDSQRIVTVDDAARVQIWDSSNGKAIGPPLGGVPRERGDPILFGSGIGWSPRGDRLVSIGLDSLIIWPLGPNDEPTTPLTVRTGWLERVAWAPDGSRIATVDLNGSIQLWDPTTGIPDGAPLAGADMLLGGSIAWSPDSARLAVTSSSGTRIWQLAERAKPDLDLTDVGGAGIAWAPDGTRFLVVGHELRVLDAATGSRIGELVYDHEAQTYLNQSRMVGVTWSRSDNRIMTSALDGSVRFWSPNVGVVAPPIIQAAESVVSIVWPEEGDRLIVEELGAVRTWSLGSSPPALHASIDREINVISVSPDGRYVATGGVAVPGRVLDATTGDQVAVLEGQPGIDSLVWAPRGPWLAAVGIDGEIWLWDVQQGVPVGPPLTTADRAKSSSVDWSPDGTQLVIAESPSDAQGPLRLWNFSTATSGRVLNGQTKEHSVAWSPDGQKIATIGDKESVWIYDIASGARSRAQLASAGLSGGIVWHPGSTYFAVATGDTIAFLDAGTGSVIGSLEPGGGAVQGFDFSPDGSQLATATEDYTIRLWGSTTERTACEIVRAALSPPILTGLLGPDRPTPVCAHENSPHIRPSVPLVSVARPR